MSKKFILFAMMTCLMFAANAETKEEALKNKMQDKIGEYTYDVLVDGKSYGSQTIKIAKQGKDELLVSLSQSIEYSVAWVFSYTYKQTSEEVWTGAQLSSFSSSSNDDGKEHFAKFYMEKGVLKVFHNKKNVENVKIPATTNNCWNLADFVETYDSFALIDTQIGEVSTGACKKLGTETLTIAGKGISSTRYKLPKEDWGEAWFDNNGLLLKTKASLEGYVVEVILIDWK